MSLNKSSKKLIAIIVCAVVVLAAAGVCIGVFANKKKAPLKIAFFQIPEAVSSVLEKKITQIYTGEAEFFKLEEQDFDAKKLSSKYDLIFSYSGSASNQLAKHCRTVPAEIYSNMPRAFLDKTHCQVPVLLDHYEFAYYRPSRVSDDYGIPETFNDLTNYLQKAKSNVFVPFFCAGGDDKTLLALIGAFVESYGGSSAYKDFASYVAENPSLKTVSKKKFSIPGESLTEFTVLDILDVLRKWQDSEMTHPEWYNASYSDVKIFMEDKDIGCVFMPLSYHRTISYKVIRDFESYRVPVRSTSANHGLIAPEVVGIRFSASNDCEQLLLALVSEENQENISDQTKLAPVNLRCSAFDRQSDDVRFFAAACKDGPIPALKDAAFQSDSATAHDFAEEIRFYLRNGRLE